MQVALLAKNKLCFIDGTFQEPDDRDSDLYSQWRFVDSMIISWIINSMSKDLAKLTFTVALLANSGLILLISLVKATSRRSST